MLAAVNIYFTISSQYRDWLKAMSSTVSKKGTLQFHRYKVKDKSLSQHISTFYLSCLYFQLPPPPQQPTQQNSAEQQHGGSGNLSGQSAQPYQPEHTQQPPYNPGAPPAYTTNPPQPPGQYQQGQFRPPAANQGYPPQQRNMNYQNNQQRFHQPGSVMYANDRDDYRYRGRRGSGGGGIGNFATGMLVGGALGGGLGMGKTSVSY